MPANQDVVYGASLDDDEVLAAYKRIVQGAAQSADKAAAAFDKMAKKIEEIADGLDDTNRKGKKSFDGMGKSIASSTVNLERFRAIGDEVVQTLVRLGVQAAKAFAAAVAGGIELNREAELVQLSVTAIFEGNEKAAQAFLELIDQTAIKLGASRQELRSLAKGLLPDIGDIELTNKLVEQLIILGRDAGASFTSIRIAAEEALSGQNLQSLARRLNLGSVISQAEKYAKTMGQAAGLSLALQERIEKTGLSTEVTADSLEVLLNTLRAEVLGLQTILGEGPAQELKEQITSILEAFQNNRSDIETVAKAFGDFAATVIEVVGSGISNLLNNLDYDGLQETADNFSRLVIKAELLAKILFDPELVNGLNQAANDILGALSAALETAAKLAALSKAGQAKSKAEQEALEEIDPNLAFVVGAGVTKALGLVTEEEQAKIDAAGQAAYKEELLRSVAALESAEQAEQDLEDKIADRSKVQEKATDADLEAANALIELQKAEEVAKDAADRAAKAQESINDKRKKLAIDLTRELLRINRQFQNKIIEDEIRNARTREKNQLTHNRKLEDIARKNQQRLEDARGDLGEKEAELAQEKADERLQIEREKGKELADAEKNLANELLRIQEQFFLSSEEAERNNDVQAFLAAVRRRDQQVTEAKRERDETVDEAESQALEREEELKRSYEQDLANLKSNNEKKLRELQTQLERELEAEKIADERRKQDADIANAQAIEDTKRRNAIELEEFRIKEAQRRKDLEESLAAEFAILEENAQAKIDLAKLTADAIIDETKRAITAGTDKFGLGKKKSKFGTAPIVEETGLFLPVISRAEGGDLVPNKPTVVGEDGPELIIPQGPGFVIPNTFFRQPTAGGGGGTQNIFNDNRSPNISMPIGPDMMSNPVLRNMVTQVAREIVAEALR